MKGKTTYYKIINWTRISVKTKQDSRNYDMYPESWTHVMN